MASVEEKPQEEEEDPEIIRELKKLDDQYLALEREFEAQERALRARFKERQLPLLQQRTDILAECSETNTQDAADKGTPALKGFWFQALSHHPAFGEEGTLEEWDEPVLEYLQNISTAVVEDEHGLSFRLDFMFIENPFFEERLMSKTYTVRETSPWTGETDVKEIRSTTITWKPDMDVTVELTKKKVKGGGAKKNKQAKEKIQPRSSFFRTFLGVNLTEGQQVPDSLAILAEAIKKEAANEDEDFDEDQSLAGFIMERDYELGTAIRDSIIPYAVRWYTGEACPDESEEGEDEDSEEEEDDDGDEDEEQEEEEAKSKNKSQATNKEKRKLAADGAGGKKEEDCKQQ